MGGVSSIAYKNPGDIDLVERSQVLDLNLNNGQQPTLEDIAKKILSNNINNIVILSGAGISVSCGIPDFRSKGTGLYENLQKYNLEKPENIFDIEFFNTNPQPFIQLAKDLFPGKFQPSVTHYFMKLLEKKNKLLRVYTQNIDGLEFLAGLSDDKVVQCHGGFQTSHCINTKCEEPCDNERLKKDILAGNETRCEKCNSLCKPGITFFGEALPGKYHDTKALDFVREESQCCSQDCKDPTVQKPDGSRHFYCEWHSNNRGKKPSPKCSGGEEIQTDNQTIETDIEEKDITGVIAHSEDKDEQTDDSPALTEEPSKVTCACDLIIVMGTSLAVAPVAGLVDDVHWLCPRVLINREVVHQHGGPKPSWPPQIGPDNGFLFDQDDNYRDVKWIGDCDEGSRQLAVLLGWEDELDELVAAGERAFATTSNVE